jgi:EF hand
MRCVLSVGLMLSFVAVAVAEDKPNFPGGPRGGQEEMKQRMMQQAMAGKIPDEVKKLIDRNGDGQLSPQEMAMAREYMARMQQQGGAAGGFAGANAQAGAFGAAGGNGGGAPQITPEMQKKFDKNGDGQLDDAEKKALMEAVGGKQKSRQQQLKEKLDTNCDGKIDDTERAAAKEAFKNRTNGKKE